LQDVLPRWQLSRQGLTLAAAAAARWGAAPSRPAALAEKLWERAVGLEAPAPIPARPEAR